MRRLKRDVFAALLGMALAITIGELAWGQAMPPPAQTCEQRLEAVEKQNLEIREQALREAFQGVQTEKAAMACRKQVSELEAKNKQAQHPTPPTTPPTPPQQK